VGHSGRRIQARVTIRRALVIIAALTAAVAIAYAVTPFRPRFGLSTLPRPPRVSNAPSGYSVEATAASFHSSCGPPIVDAWHSAPLHWTFGPGRIANGFARFTASATGSACRRAAQHRLAFPALGLLAASACVVVARFLRRRPSVAVRA
jgi:hypothetical protein